MYALNSRAVRLRLHYSNTHSGIGDLLRVESRPIEEESDCTWQELNYKEKRTCNKPRDRSLVTARELINHGKLVI